MFIRFAHLQLVQTCVYVYMLFWSLRERSLSEPSLARVVAENIVFASFRVV